MLGIASRPTAREPRKGGSREERRWDYNNGKPKDAVDAVSGKLVYAIQVTDPSAKGKNTGHFAKMAVDVQPVSPEAIPGTPFRSAVFAEMSPVPYVPCVRDGMSVGEGNALGPTLSSHDCMARLARQRAP